MRRLLLRLLGGVPFESYDDARLREYQLRADLARVERERDAARAQAGRWATEEGKTANANIQLEADLLDAHQRIADLEAKLAEATSPLALAERRYAQARLRYLRGRGLGESSEHWEPMLSAEGALRRAAIDAAAAKGEGGEGER